MSETKVTPRVDYLPVDAEFVGTFQARQDLGIEFEEPHGINYLDSPLGVYVSETKAGRRYDVVVDHEPLMGDELHGFLSEAAPNKSHFDRGAVTSDWQVVDRATTSRRRWVNAEDKALVTTHSLLGEPWEEFMRSRTTFLDALDDETRIPDLYNLHYCCSKPEDKSPRGILEDLVTVRSQTLEGMLTMLEEAGIEDPPERILEEFQLHVGGDFREEIRSLKIDNLEGVKRAIEVGHLNKSVLYRALGRLSDEQVEFFAQQALRTIYDEIELEDGTVFITLSDRLNIPLSESLTRRHTVIDGPYTKEVIPVQFKDGETHDLVLPGTVERVIPFVTISPAITWVQGSENRKFILERRTSHTNFQRVDGVLGVLAVAYFSPDIRAGWREYLPIRNSREQVMGPAQVPVLALMRKAQLLKSRFVETAETLAS
jgi:hypothetical protein